MLALLVSSVHRGRAIATPIEEQAGLHCMLIRLLIVLHSAVLFYDQEEYTELDHGAVYSRDNGSVGIFRKTAQ
jgi:hypothetical protein